MSGPNDKISIKGHLWDLLAFKKLTSRRRKRIAQASDKPLSTDPICDLARQLHPDRQHLLIQRIRDETKTTRTFRLIPDPDSDTKSLACFRPGQYLSLHVPINGVRITRPYSISSAPHEALGQDGFYEITIKKTENGFLTEHIWQHWQTGTRIESSGPEGHFYYEPLRDSPNIVGLAGGSGITPFRSMAKAIVYGELDVNLVLLYGSSDQDDIIFYDEFKELESKAPDKFRIVHVLSCEEVSREGCEQGFLTAELIRKYANVETSSFFICGPQVMYHFVEKELATLQIPRKRIRRELYGTIKDVSQLPDFPLNIADETFKLCVHIGGLTAEIPAKAAETVLTAMERANLAPPSKCRSGECGFCRALLLQGTVYVSPECDGRRAADRLYNYIHPCASWPIGDLEIKIPRGE